MKQAGLLNTAVAISTGAPIIPDVPPKFSRDQCPEASLGCRQCLAMSPIAPACQPFFGIGPPAARRLTRPCTTRPPALFHTGTDRHAPWLSPSLSLRRRQATEPRLRPMLKASDVRRELVGVEFHQHAPRTYGRFRLLRQVHASALLFVRLCRPSERWSFFRPADVLIRRFRRHPDKCRKLADCSV